MAILQAALPSEVLASTDWHRYIDAADPDGLWSLSTRLFQACKEREAEGIVPESELLKLVSSAASMRLTDGGKPVFQPMVIYHSESSRSPALEDFEAIDVEALSVLAETTQTPSIRARLGDVAVTAAVELGLKQWRGGVIAATAYLELAEQYLLEPNGIRVLTEFLRGLRLAWVYCRKDQSLRDRYWALAQKAITQSLSGNAPGIAFILTAEVKKGRHDLAAGLAADFEAAAARYTAQGDSDTAARCFEHAFELWERIGNRVEAKRCQLMQGEALVARATSGASAMVGASWLAQGLDVLRRAGATPARITELRQELAAVQRRSLDEFKRIEHSADVSDVVRVIEARLVGPSFIESLMQMSFDLGRWPAFDKVRQTVIDTAQQFPLSAFFASTVVNAEGAVVARQKSFDASDPEAVYQAMVKHCHDFEINFRADVLIGRSADFLFIGHHPSLFSVLEIVQASPMVPHGHAQSLARGLFAGIHRDWLEAATYLIPQVESFVRHQFRQHDLITLAMRDDGTQSEKSLTELLQADEAEHILGKDLILELNTLMVHPLGYALRHKWAHGLADDRQIVNPGVLGLWWTLWRLILWPWAVERNHALQAEAAARDARAARRQSPVDNGS